MGRTDRKSISSMAGLGFSRSQSAPQFRMRSRSRSNSRRGSHGCRDSNASSLGASVNLARSGSFSSSVRGSTITAATVASQFTSCHSPLGLALREFTDRVLLLFDRGPSTGDMYISHWDNKVVKNVPNFASELKPLGTLFQYIHNCLEGIEKETVECMSFELKESMKAQIKRDLGIKPEDEVNGLQFTLLETTRALQDVLRAVPGAKDIPIEMDPVKNAIKRMETFETGRKAEWERRRAQVDMAGRAKWTAVVHGTRHLYTRVTNMQLDPRKAVEFPEINPPLQQTRIRWKAKENTLAQTTRCLDASLTVPGSGLKSASTQTFGLVVAPPASPRRSEQRGRPTSKQVSRSVFVASQDAKEACELLFPMVGACPRTQAATARGVMSHGEELRRAREEVLGAGANDNVVFHM